MLLPKGAAVQLALAQSEGSANPLETEFWNGIWGFGEVSVVYQGWRRVVTAAAALLILFSLSSINLSSQVHSDMRQQNHW